jgi:molybdopterin-guanine dinucleotide biosynthesis protein A
LIETQPPGRNAITGLILAGGRAHRMGGRDKGLVTFAGRPLIEWVARALAPQVAVVLVNANRNLDAYASLGHPVVADAMRDFQGPLAGLSAAMTVCRTAWILMVPCDGPFLAPDLAERLAAALARERAEIAVASDGARVQPVHALIPTRLAPGLHAYLAGGDRKVELWYARHRLAIADLSDQPGCFANVNRDTDIGALEPGWTSLPGGQNGTGTEPEPEPEPEPGS